MALHLFPRAPFPTAHHAGSAAHHARMLSSLLSAASCLCTYSTFCGMSSEGGAARAVGMPPDMRHKSASLSCTPPGAVHRGAAIKKPLDVDFRSSDQGTYTASGSWQSRAWLE
eukprot:358772-Chlamydomonas_euryale.AAC.10